MKSGGNEINDLNWSLYMIRCHDDSIYTGITNDLLRRMMTHFSGGAQSAKYIKAKKPKDLIYTIALRDKSIASQLEYRVKKLPKQKKEALVRGERSLYELLPDFAFECI